MKAIWTLVACVGLAFPLAARADESPNSLSSYEQRGGWRLLFDGKSFENWRNYQEEAVRDGWQVQDGAMVRNGKGAGDIITKDKFDEFELSLEYRISKGGNSGVMFHVTEEEKRPWQTGPEIQIQDNQDGHDPQLAGWLYQLYKPTKPGWAIKFEKQAGISSPDVVDATKPAGQWNHLYVRISKGQSEVALNGVSYYKFRKGGKDWDQRVAQSKFSKFPKFGKAESGHICLQDHGNVVAYRNVKVRPLSAGGVPNPIDKKLPITSNVAFPNVKWAGWDSGEETGKRTVLRPLTLTYASNSDPRVFVAMQGGGIHVLPLRDDAEASKMFLDLRDRVAPWKANNEEGLLGLAFHPEYAKTGEFFVYYSSKDKPFTSIVSRFRVSKDDPDKANPQEEVVMRIPQPFANHNGGSIAFGPDGFLYIGLGDGGGRNDPMRNGQNLNSWMGSILRIDVNNKDADKNYAVPSDNPFVGRKKVKPEIYAFGFRNIWRLAFDQQTGALWAADVGQDLWEEINIVQKGGNYGWSIREANHGFSNTKPSVDIAPRNPVWEYDHQVGKSITGGCVYRGKAIPELQGKYLYADYVSGHIWALDVDPKTGDAKGNYGLREGGLPVLAFGEDQRGEVYYFVAAPDGKCIYRFEQE